MPPTEEPRAEARGQPLAFALAMPAGAQAFALATPAGHPAFHQRGVADTPTVKWHP